MPTPPGLDRGTHLVAVLDGTTLWTTPSGSLPRVEADHPDLAGLVPGRPDVGFAAPRQAVGPGALHVLVVRGPGAARPADRRALPLDRLDDLAEEPEVRDRIRQETDRFRGVLAPPPRRQRWYAERWLKETTGWVDAVLGDLRWARTDPGRVLRTWPLSTLVRYGGRDSGGQERGVVLKATCDHFAAEPAVTALVAELAPDVAPVVLATAHDRQLLLMEEFEEGSGPDGESVARSRPVLVQSARLLARLQIASAGTPRRLRRAGCPDRGQDDTCHGLDRVLNDGSELGRLDPTERDALEALRPGLGDLVHDLYRTGPPPALVHGDLHAGNIAATPTGSVRIFDWSDAAVAHPALDVAHLTAHLTERPGDADAVWEA